MGLSEADFRHLIGQNARILGNVTPIPGPSMQAPDFEGAEALGHAEQARLVRRSGMIIGIDPGTSCGWGLLGPDGTRSSSGEWDLKPRRHEGGGMRYLRFARLLTQLLESGGNIEAVVYEEVRRHAGTDAAHVYGGIVAQLGVVCETKGIPYSGIPVGTVKKTATGKGNASKEMMIAAALLRWPELHDIADNEADALWIAETWRAGNG